MRAAKSAINQFGKRTGEEDPTYLLAFVIPDVVWNGHYRNFAYIRRACLNLLKKLNIRENGKNRQNTPFNENDHWRESEAELSFLRNDLSKFTFLHQKYIMGFSEREQMESAGISKSTLHREIDQEKKNAKEELAAWKGYSGNRRKSLPDHNITPV